MDMVTLTIDGQKVSVPWGTSVLDAARAAGIDIPTLCYLKDINVVGVCRVCVVEIEGAKSLQASCVTPAAEGMVVRTNTQAVREARRTVVELILSNHPFECLTCERNRNCELQELAERLGIREVEYEGERVEFSRDTSSAAIVRDPNKCILCRRCMSVCSQIQTVFAIAPNDRGFETMIAPPFADPLADVACTQCGQCTLVCPTGALTEKDSTAEVYAALWDPSKHVVVQTAPAVRATVGEECGLPPGTLVTGNLVTALRRLGFDRVFDTDFTADLTIMEEGHEFLERLQHGGKLPLITSCSPGWIKFIEHFYPDLLDNLSTCKSPQQMFGALAKTYYAEKAGVDPGDIFVVSVMPCTAKKFEAKRPEMTSSGYPDVDAVLTSRELGRMLREAGLDLATLPEGEYDAPLGISTGAGVIFGATGGVMEAALRTVYEVVMDRELESVDFEEVRGLKGVKEATVSLDGIKVKVAVAHGLGNARKLLDKVREGTAEYHFIEIMCCPGGCIGGGGQPIPTDDEIRAKRIDAIYREDRGMKLRKSHLNPAVRALYEEFLEEPLSHRAHQLLHTTYLPRGRFPVKIA